MFLEYLGARNIEMNLSLRNLEFLTENKMSFVMSP